MSPDSVSHPVSPSPAHTDLGTVRRLAGDVVGQEPSARTALGRAFDGWDPKTNGAVPSAAPLEARAPGTIPRTATFLARELPKVVIVDLRHMGDYLPPDVLKSMAELMEVGVHFVLISDKPQAGHRSVDEMINRGLAMGGPNSILRRRLMSLSNDGNLLYQYYDGSRRLIQPKRFSRPLLAAFNEALEKTRIGYKVAGYARNFTAKPKRLHTAQELADAMVEALDEAGIPRDAYSLSFVEKGTEMQVQFRPTTLARAVPDIVSALEELGGVKAEMKDVLVISKGKAVLDATAGALQPALEAPEAGGETLLRACLKAMLAGW